MQKEVVPFPNESLNFEQSSKRLIEPLISAVLVTKGDRLVLLERCLKSLQKQTFREFEIVLVYSIFPSNLSSFLENNNLVVIKENGSTIAEARSLGVKHAKGDLIAFIDDDCEAPENWLEQVYSTFVRYPQLSCLGGPPLTSSEDSLKNPLMFVQGSFMQSVMQRVCLDRSAVGKISTSNVVYRKMIFDKIGNFDEKLKSGEDWDFNIRLAEKGYTLRFDPAIFVWHHSHGLKHAFVRSSEMVPFFLSWKTLRYAKYESTFASFYITNSLFLLLLIILFFSPIVFSFLLFFSLLCYFIFAAVRTKTLNRKITFYPLILLFTFARIMGFYFGLFKRLGQLASV
jgi:GT2 family glycosyltransferase